MKKEKVHISINKESRLKVEDMRIENKRPSISNMIEYLITTHPEYKNFKPLNQYEK